MGKIIILPETTKNPLTLIGERAGICWGTDISDSEKNYKRGIDCLEHNHGRTLEFVNIEMVIDGYSAKVIREWYTHLGGAPTRLQASTRYIDYSNFSYIIPSKIGNNAEAAKVYMDEMGRISESINKLLELGIPNEDATMILPLAMATKIVDKRNLRNLIDMSRQRMCSRAYWEYRVMFNDILDALRDYSEEWKYIVDYYMHPKCIDLGGCPEKRPCGYFEKLKQFEELEKEA